TAVEDFEIENGNIKGIICKDQKITADVVILSLGSWMKKAAEK
ncbi:MAG: FAD-dependent oxidoreductase, partial [Pedobacter sp.]|nr:FAD-dependent oxidoreductase [Pedobacter sp.]